MFHSKQIYKMTDNNIGSMVASDLTNAVEDFSVQPESTDAHSGDGETIYYITEAEEYLGYYNKIPELRSVIDAKATWTVGKGFQADEITTMLLDTIKGFGKDTFNTILENLARDKEIYGDAFAEIIRDDEENLINLKVLDPAVMGIVVDEKGLVKRYEQNGKVKDKKTKTFETDEIFHLARNRVADQIHGTSLIKALKDIIDSKNEVMKDMRTLMHRHVIPQWKFKLKTDDPDEINAYKAKMDAAVGNGENIYEPYDVAEGELISVAPNATLNPMQWMEYLNNQFYQTAGVPQIILGGSAEFTEASAKIAYLAFEQNIREEQLFLEEQTLSQLNLVIELELPASLENELLSDQNKDGMNSENPLGINPSETTAGEGQ